MKILVLTSTFPRWQKDTEPRFVADLCSQLSKEHEIHVLAPHALNTEAREVNAGVQIYRFRYCLAMFETLAYNGGMLPNLKRNPLKVLLIPLFLLGQLWKTLRLVRANDYDLIHAHWLIPQGITVAIVKLLYGNKVKVIITSHGGDLFSLKGKVATKIKQWVLNKCDHLCVVSQTMKEVAIGLGIDQDDVSVAPMGVDLQNKFTPPETDGPRQGLIFVGRLVEKKGVEYLIKAFALILKKYPDERLNIIGSGPLQDKLENLANELHVASKINFMGPLQNELIPDELRKAKIAVIPSIITDSGDQEGLGLTIVEAMGCECAVVASKLPAIDDVVTSEKAGLLVSQKDPDELAAKIIYLLDTPVLAKEISQFGRICSLEKFDWQTVGSNYLRIFNAVKSK